MINNSDNDLQHNSEIYNKIMLEKLRIYEHLGRC